MKTEINVKALIDATNKQVRVQYSKTAAAIRKAVIVPFCDKYGLLFKQGMGAFIFIFKDENKKHVKLCCNATRFGHSSVISDKDVKLLGDEFIDELEEVSDLIYEELGSRRVFEYMENYPDGN